jgi:hypothetical protein
MHETLDGTFTFASLDPGFELLFTALKHGQIQLDTRIVTEDNGDWSGEYRRRQLIDQSYLPALIGGLTRIVSRFPIVGKPA